MLTNIEQYKYKKYKINSDKIISIFKLFDECLQILENNNIKYTITGSVGLLLNTNKIYRSIGDIDFVIEKRPTLLEIYEFTSRGFKHLFENNKKINFMKNGIYIELFYKLPTSNNINKIKYKNRIINCFSVEDIFFYKKVTSYMLKLKDEDDMRFYKKFIKLT
jgi:hypothetical protein